MNGFEDGGSVWRMAIFIIFAGVLLSVDAGLMYVILKGIWQWTWK